MKKRITSMILALTFLLSTMICFDVAVVDAATSGTCGSGANWSYDSSTATLTITGKGAISDYGTTALNRAPWYSEKANITTVVVGEGITALGQLCFYNCPKLTSVSLPSTLTKIKGGTLNYGSFRECTGLEQITLPEGLESIDAMAFRGCSALKSITIPDSVTSLGTSAFRECSNLETVTFGTGLTSTGFESFYDSGVKKINFSSSITQISAYSFFNTRISSIEIPETITAIGTRSFANCTHITSVTVYNSNCEFQGIIGEDPFNGSAQSITFYGHSGSTTQIYAETKGYGFVSIDPCNHETTHEVIVTPATCVDAGVSTQVCDNCGFVVSQTTLPATDHTWEVIETVDSTQEDGHIYTTSECSSCHETKEEIQHVAFVDGYYDYTNTATCTRAGFETYTCNVENCGKVQRTVAQSGNHSIDEWTVTAQPTCTQAGSQQGVCSSCGETITQDISALGHDNQLIDTLDNTEEDGHTYEIYKCSICEEETVVPTHVNWVEGFYTSTVLTQPGCVLNGTQRDVCTVENCGKSQIVQIPANGEHAWYETSRTEPTCSAKGTIYYACENCNMTKQESIDALGHDYVKVEENSVAPTCKNAGYNSYKCNRCAATTREVVNALGHTADESNYTVVTEPTCVDTGVANTVCTVCGESYEITLDANGHDYQDIFVPIESEPGHCLVTPTCSVCGSTKTSSKSHSEWYDGDYTTTVITQGSCTVARVTVDTCNYCGTTRRNTTEAPGHNYSYTGINDNGYLAYTCANCNNVNALNPNIVLGLWNAEYLNQLPADVSSGYLFELHKDDVISVKDYVIISRAAKALQRSSETQ